MKTHITIDGTRVPMTNSMKELGRIGKEVRRRARISLKARGKVVTGKLYNSIRYEQGVSRDEKSLNLTFSFPGADYAKFVDEGVRGALSSSKAPRSPFRFGSGSGPSGGLRPAIDKWVVKKGIAPRGAGGQFAARKGMVYAISRSIYQTGIRPSYFFTISAELRPHRYLQSSGPPISSRTPTTGPSRSTTRNWRRPSARI